MNFNKWAFKYVFTCSIVAYHRDRNRFLWIMQTVLKNWSIFYAKKLIRKLQKEGVKV